MSGCIGKGDLNHNNRSIITANVDKEKIADDIIICQRSLKKLYHELFDEALEEFNAKQTRNKDSILSWIDTLKSLTKTAMEKQRKADRTIFSLHKRGDEFIAERDEARVELNAVRKENSGLSSELKTVKSENRRYSEVYSMLERIAPDILRQAKALVQEEKEQCQREQAQQIEYQPTKKKRSWGLE